MADQDHLVTSLERTTRGSAVAMARLDHPPLTPNAMHSWEEFETPFSDGPHTVDEVVVELLGKPVNEVKMQPIIIVPVKWFSLEGEAFGVRFRLILVPKPDGSGWHEVHDIHCLGKSDA